MKLGMSQKKKIHWDYSGVNESPIPVGDKWKNWQESERRQQVRKRYFQGNEISPFSYLFVRIFMMTMKMFLFPFFCKILGRSTKDLKHCLSNTFTQLDTSESLKWNTDKMSSNKESEVLQKCFSFLFVFIPKDQVKWLPEGCISASVHLHQSISVTIQFSKITFSYCECGLLCFIKRMKPNSDESNFILILPVYLLPLLKCSN